MELAIDEFGRMVLPKSILDDLGLEPGDRLEAIEQDGAIVLRPVREQAALGDKDGVLVFAGVADGDIVGAVGQRRRERIERIAGQRQRP